MYVAADFVRVCAALGRNQVHIKSSLDFLAKLQAIDRYRTYVIIVKSRVCDRASSSGVRSARLGTLGCYGSMNNDVSVNSAKDVCCGSLFSNVKGYLFIYCRAAS